MHLLYQCINNNINYLLLTNLKCAEKFNLLKPVPNGELVNL